MNRDGTRTAVLSRDVVNFQATDGSWQPVDNTVEADPLLVGGLRNRANGWRAHFGDTSRGVTFETAGGSVSMVPAAAGVVAPAGQGAVVRYPGAWSKTDLDYQVTGSSVKESILIRAADGPTSFVFDVRAGSVAELLATRGAKAALAIRPDGSAVVGDPALGVRIAAPMVLRADGAPVPEAGAQLAVNPDGQLVVSLDRAWLAAQPASAFPVVLDPSVGFNDDGEVSYKSDGYSCSACGLQFGNSRDVVSGVVRDRWWRSAAHYNYESLFGKQFLSAAFHPTYRSGTTSPLGINVFWASGFSYAGVVGNGAPLAQGSVNDQWIGGPGLDATLSSWLSNSTSGGWFGFGGDERSGVYTYQRDYLDLYINYNSIPAVPALAPGSPGDGGTYHQLNYGFAVSGSDPDGDPLQYFFRASTNPNPDLAPVFEAGWQAGSSTATVFPWWLWNTRLYWHVYVCQRSRNSPVVSG